MPEALHRHDLRSSRGACGRAGSASASGTGLGKIDLRGDPHDRGFMAAVGRVLDLLLPSEPCTSAARIRSARSGSARTNGW